MNRKIIIYGCQGCPYYVPCIDFRQRNKKPWCSEAKKYFEYEEGIFPEICPLEGEK